MGSSQPFFSRPLVREVPGPQGAVVYLRPSKATATASIFLVLLIGAETWVASLFFRNQIPSSTTPMGTIAVWIASGALGVVAAATLFIAGWGALELFRYWTMTIKLDSRTVTIRQRTPFGQSEDTFAFGDIEEVLVSRPASQMNWLVQLNVRGKRPIRLGMAPQVYAEAFAQRLASLTDVEVKGEMRSP